MNEPGPCVIEDCAGKTTSRSGLCTKHWLGLPAALRKKWWDATDYAKKAPSAELLAEVQAAARA